MNVESRLETVTIYREGAVCTRRAKLERCAKELRLVGLPLSLVPGSVRGRVVTGPVGLRVLDVRPGFDVQFGDAVDESAETKAKDEARLEVARLEAVYARLDSEVRELQTLRPISFTPKEGDPPRAAPVEASLALTAFVDERLSRLLIDKRTAERELNDAREELKLRERRLTEASAEKRTSKAKVTRAIVLSMSSEAAGPIELEVEYQVPGVRWVPNYALRLERGFGGGTLRMRAAIAQDTGEDWKGVALSLSTATLDRRTDVPELKSLRIGRTQPEPPKPGFRSPPQGLDELFDGFDTMVRSHAPPATPPVQERAQPARPKPQPAPKKRAKHRPDGPFDSVDGAIADAAMVLESTVMRRDRIVAPGAPPPAPPPPARVAAAPMAQAVSAGGGFGAALGAKTDTHEPPGMAMEKELDEGGYGPNDEEEVTGAGFLVPTLAEPLFLPAADLLDYDRLRMPGAFAPSRGRLAQAPELEAAFEVGISVHVDVVIALTQTWRWRAGQIANLGLPPRCVPVASFDQFDFRYDCAGPVDLPSIAAWTTVSVMDCRVGLSPQYVCVPSVEPKVYRTLAIANGTTSALLSGPVEVSVGDEFLMTTTMPAIPPGANTERLGLGVEEAIKVARKSAFAETTGGFLGGSTVLKHDVEIELNNRLGAAVSIEVRERLPQVPANEKDIKVEEAEVKPAWEKVDGPLDGLLVAGLRRWRLSVPAGSRSTLTAQYLVRIPADKMLVGGNRRG
jgi:hypothetical protein